jgi:flagellar assembly protein FliH
MRSLPNVIKASEYVAIKNGQAFPANSRDLRTAQGVQDEQQIIVDKAHQEAQQLIEAAQTYSMNKVKESAQRMNEEAAQVWARSHEEGYEKGLSEGQKTGTELGYKNGYEQGLAKAEEQNKATLAELTTMLEIAEKMKTEILQKFEDDIGQLAVAIAEKIIKKELSIDAKAMQEIILNAMDCYTNQGWIKIFVSKETKSQLLNADNSIIEALREVSENVKIEVSPDMKSGDCKIELPDRMVDAGVDTQMTRIKQALSL